MPQSAEQSAPAEFGGSGDAFRLNPAFGLAPIPSRSSRPSVFLRLAVGLGSVVIAASVRMALNPFLGDHHAYTFFFAAIALTSWYAGFWPSVLAVALSYVAADWFFIPPLYAFDFWQFGLDEFIGLGGFVCSGLAIAFTSRALHRARDVAETRRAELAMAQAELKRHADLLEASVQERTAHLTETIQSLEGVCYHIAHDLRGPLRTMEGFSTILLEDHGTQVTPSARDCLQRVAAAARRMDSLIESLLEYGALGHGAFALSMVDLNVQVDRVLAAWDEELRRKGAEIHVRRPMPPVWANAGLIYQILGHLLSNALKFSSPGVRPCIEIGAVQNQSSVRLWVQDNGIGIAPQHQSRIFRIFEQLQPPGTVPGTGMGLAIVAKAVHRMKGAVGVDSEPGKGSRVWVDFPGVPASEPDRSSAAPACIQSMPAAIGGRS